MGPSAESLALADFLISKLGLQIDRISLAYAIMDHVEVEYADELAQPSPGGQGDVQSVRRFIAERTTNPEQRQDVLDGDYDWSEWFGHVQAALAACQPVDENYEVWAQNAENVAAELTDERAIKALRFAARGIRSAARQPVGQAPVSNLLTLCRDSHPPLMNHSSSYGGVWASDWCVVFRANGSACVARYEVSEMDKRYMDESGAVPNFPWRVPGFGHVVAWAMVSDVVAHISRLTDAAPPAQAVDLWQPIATAPDDVPADGAVLVCITHDEPGFAGQRMVGEAYKVDGVWWWAGSAPNDYHTDPIEDMYGLGCVTHWQPMPEPALIDSQAVGNG